MEFLLFYSKYSDKCAALFQEIPLLNEKAICVDSAESRVLLRALPYQVKRVPTLFVTDGINQIIKVLEGVQEIRNWFLLITYSLSSGGGGGGDEQLDIAEPDDDMMPPPNSSVIDDSMFAEDVGQMKGIKAGGGGDVKNLADEMARERERYFEAGDPARQR